MKEEKRSAEKRRDEEIDSSFKTKTLMGSSFRRLGRTFCRLRKALVNHYMIAFHIDRVIC